MEDPSWDEGRHTLRRPGLGDVFAALLDAGLNYLRCTERINPVLTLLPACKYYSDHENFRGRHAWLG